MANLNYNILDRDIRKAIEERVEYLSGELESQCGESLTLSDFDIYIGSSAITKATRVGLKYKGNFCNEGELYIMKDGRLVITNYEEDDFTGLMEDVGLVKFTR